VSGESEGRELADQLRREHALGAAPINDLFEFVHRVAGIDVLSMTTNGDEHGLSMVDPRSGRTVVAVATTPHPMRQRSSIAHELGHIVAGDLDGEITWEPGQRSLPEVRADSFARHLLLPEAAVKNRTWTTPPTLAQLSAVVQENGVSPRLAAIQLRGARLIDHATCDAWSATSSRALAVQFGWLGQYRALSQESTQERAPQALTARAVAAYQQGKLGLAELALWFGADAGDSVAEIAGVGTPAGTAPPEPDEEWDSDAPLFPGTDTGSMP
jgi:Zn-dependent peptidase ImmA (M78 family)